MESIKELVIKFKSSHDTDIITKILKKLVSSEVGSYTDILDPLRDLVIYLDLNYEAGTIFISDDLFDQLIEIFKDITSSVGIDFDKMVKDYRINYVSSKDTTKDKVKLPFPLHSLSKVNNISDLQKWKKNFDETITMILTPKIDGVSSLIDIKSKDIYTKGDGFYGKKLIGFSEILMDDRKNSKPERNNIEYSDPTLEITDIGDEMFEEKLIFYKDLSNNHYAVNHDLIQYIRGEFVMQEPEFEEFKRKYPGKYTTSRNLLCGAINQKELNDKKKEIIKSSIFYAYEIIYPEYIFSDQLKLLKENNIRTVPFKIVHSNEIDIDLLDETLRNWRQSLPVLVDGIVIRVNKIYPHSGIDNPKYQIAYKQESTIHINSVGDISWKINKFNEYIPTIILKDPIHYNNRTYNKVAGHNYNYLKEASIGIGSSIRIYFVGDLPVLKGLEGENPENTYLNLPDDSIITDGKLLSTERSSSLPSLVTYFIKNLGVTGIGEATVRNIINDTGGSTVIEVISKSKHPKITEMLGKYYSFKELLIALNTDISHNIIELFQRVPDFKPYQDTPNIFRAKSQTKLLRALSNYNSERNLIEQTFKIKY